LAADDHSNQLGQNEIFAYLADPATHGGAKVLRIDTHSAVVFLAADRAIKVKRAVHYAFLDFSSLDKRKAACAAEVEINRLFAPGIYRGVIAITRRPDSTLALTPASTAEQMLQAGEGTDAVEWAVDMRRFDETATLDRLADRDALDLALADALARTVAASHARVPPVPAAPWIEAIASYIDQNEDTFREEKNLFDEAGAVALRAESRAMLDRLRPLLRIRGQRGLVRRGHGDLHLGNVALIEGKPVPFDALEFSLLAASGDVLYDLAFLLMDLVERRLVPAANVVLNRYLAETRRAGDLDALAALPLFMSVRAAIRAKVAALRAALAAPADRAAAYAAAKAYFALACRLIRPPPPVLVGIGGLSGTGKSQLARALAPSLEPMPGAVVLRSDVERKALAGLAEDERLPREAYTAESAARVYAELIGKADRTIAAGHSAVVDAVFARPYERDALRAVAGSHGAAFHGISLAADLATRVARIGAREADASDADAATARVQESYDLGRNDWSVVDASGDQDETLRRARSAVFSDATGTSAEALARQRGPGT
jgi:aminoglycoside phosphotransferase family enzyme/predicted kinase